MNAIDLPELLTIKDAARLISVHPNTLRNWEREGKISALRIGNRRDRRFSKQSLLQVFESSISLVSTAAAVAPNSLQD